MTKLNEYFENKLSAQEQLEVQMWLAENGYNPDAEAQLEELFDKLHVDDEAAARAAFQQVASRLGITAEARNTTACRSRIAAWSQRIAAILIVPLLCAVCLLYATRQPEVEWFEKQVPYGEIASLTLPDGTHLHLNSGSRITYPSAFTGKERRIFVDGEIFADVAKDPHKPFIIRSGDVGIRVLVNHNDNEFIGCESYGRVISDRPDNDYKGTFFGQCKKAAKFRNCIAQGDVGTYNGGDCIMTGVNADNYMDYLGAYDASAVDVTPANILYRPAGN